jgi:hypothetical protein
MKETIERLKYLIETIPGKVNSMDNEKLVYRRAPGKWSKKEVMGHLCDSAMNNLIRFINAQYAPKPFEVNTYEQDDCVKAGHYQEMALDDILNFWKSTNKNIINVISYYTPEQLEHECFLGGGGEFSVYVPEEKPEYKGPNGIRTLHWLIEDYAAHMQYHLKQIIQY